MDLSNGYEAVAESFLRYRARSRVEGMGVDEVRQWARSLPRGARVIDLGCGPGIPITSTLADEGLDVFAVDASQSFVTAFRKNLPGVPVLCASVSESSLFERNFEAVLSWGLIFLQDPIEQRRLIERFSSLLNKEGQLLFTSPEYTVSWTDVMTGLESVSLGAAEYSRLLGKVGLSVVREFEDTGGNHYYLAVKR